MSHGKLPELLFDGRCLQNSKSHGRSAFRDKTPDVSFEVKYKDGYPNNPDTAYVLLKPAALPPYSTKWAPT